MTKIVTHNAKFHADDVFGVATLLLLLENENYQIIRTRDPGIIATGDYVLDVGEISDPERNRFDHHQAGGAGARENGIQYASFGLVWKEFGKTVCKSKEVADNLDKMLVQIIDASDNGQDIFKPTISNVSSFTVNSVVDLYRPTWKEKQNWDEKFLEAVRWAKLFLQRQIKMTADVLEGTKIVVDEYNKSKDKMIIQIHDEYDLGREIVMSALVRYPEPVYAILYRSDTQSWQVIAIRKTLTSFELRKSLPEAWGAKKDQELESVSGVAGALFCHRSRFMCTAQTKEGALKLAEIALNS